MSGAIPEGIPRRAWGPLLALAEVVRDEQHEAQSLSVDADTGIGYLKGGAYKYGDREALGYTGANVKDALRVLVRANFRVDIGAAEGYLQAALVALDDGEEAKLPASEAERQAKRREGLDDGSCRTCGRPAETGRYCNACKAKANARQRKARKRKKGNKP